LKRAAALIDPLDTNWIIAVPANPRTSISSHSDANGNKLLVGSDRPPLLGGKLAKILHESFGLSRKACFGRLVEDSGMIAFSFEIVSLLPDFAELGSRRKASGGVWTVNFKH
jgi:hypothetical protein